MKKVVKVIITIVLAIACVAGIVYFIYIQSLNQKLNDNIVGIWTRDYTKTIDNDTRLLYVFYDDGTGLIIEYDKVNKSITSSKEHLYTIKGNRVEIFDGGGTIIYKYEKNTVLKNGKSTYIRKHSDETTEGMIKSKMTSTFF